MTNGYDIHLALASLGGLGERRILILELPERGEDFIGYGRKEVLDEFHRILNKDTLKYRDIEMQTTAVDKQTLLRAVKQIDKAAQEFKKHLRQIADTGESWDSFVYNVLLQGKASEEDIKDFTHVSTSDGKMFGQCENCHKYIEEKKIGEGFDPHIHLCYDWEAKRELCPECFSAEGIPV